jgi:hypothetical protein
MNRVLTPAFVLAIIFATAQDVKLTFGPVTKGSYTRPFFNNTLKTGYIVNAAGEKISITPLEGYLKPGTSKTVTAETLTVNNAYLEGTMVVNGKNYLIYSLIDKKSDVITVYSQELSANMVLLGSAIKIATFKGAKSSTGVIVIGQGMLRLTEITIVKPQSQDHIVMVKERDHAIEMKAFSPEKEELWSKTFQLDKDLTYRLKNIRVAENGNVYILGTYYKGNLMNDPTMKDPFLIAYAPTTKTEKIHTISSGDKINDMGFALEFLNDETPVLAGLFYEKGKTEISYQILKVNTTTLQLEKMTAILIAKEYSDIMFKRAYDPKYFSVENIAQLENGNIVFSVDGGLVSSGKYSSTTWGAAAYVVAVNSAGIEQWNTIINKYQVTPYSSALIGHTFFIRGNNVYLMYNDNSENFDLSPAEKPKENLLKKKMYVCTIEIDETGKATKLKLVTTKKEQISWFSPATTTRIEKGLYHFKFYIGETSKYATFSN